MLKSRSQRMETPITATELNYLSGIPLRPNLPHARPVTGSLEGGEGGGRSGEGGLPGADSRGAGREVLARAEGTGAQGGRGRRRERGEGYAGSKRGARGAGACRG